MSLARVKVWIPGDVLTAADLNGEFNNVINNPITLISPTTGPINFNSQAHTGLLPSALTVSTASTGSLLVVTSSGVANWLSYGSTGQVLTISSSGLSPVFGVIPPDGGLSTTIPSTGMVYYISTSGVLKGLTAGSSGQVLTLSTNLTPSWATASASGGSALSSQASYLDDFMDGLQTSSDILSATRDNFYSDAGAGTAVSILSSKQGGVVAFSNPGAAGGFYLTSAPGLGAASPRAFLLSTLAMTATIIMSQNSTSTGQHRFGLSDSAFASTDPQNGLYFRSSAGNASTYRAVARNAGLEFLIVTTAVSASSGLANTFKIVTASSGLQATVVVNGVTAGVFTSSQMPAVALGFGMTHDGVGSQAEHYDAWQVITDRPTVI